MLNLGKNHNSLFKLYLFKYYIVKTEYFLVFFRDKSQVWKWTRNLWSSIVDLVINYIIEKINYLITFGFALQILKQNFVQPLTA